MPTTAPETTRKIITKHVYPPIPIRHCDWSAHFDDVGQEGLIGRGKTEQAAIDDLLSQQEAADEEPMMPFVLITTEGLGNMVVTGPANASYDEREAMQFETRADARRFAEGFDTSAGKGDGRLHFDPPKVRRQGDTTAYGQC